MASGLMTFSQLPSVFILIALAVTSGTPSRSSAADNLPHVGINVAAIRYWTPGFQLVDVARRADYWRSRTTGSKQWNDGRTVALSNHGYPRSLESNQVAEACLTTHSGGHYPEGEYLLIWQGKGELELVDTAIRLISRTSQQIRYRVDRPSEVGLRLAVTRTDPRDPIHDVHVLPPTQHNASTLIHPAYVQTLRGFGVVRLMDWNHTNDHPVRRWPDRCHIEDMSWSGEKGVPWEVQLALANEAGIDPWICVPHGADNDYVLNLALMVRGQLNTTRTVWLEYSNEVWNSSFGQYHWVRANLAGGMHDACAAAYGKRAAELFNIFEKVLGEKRVLNVIAGHTGNPNVLRDALRGAHQQGTKAEVAAITAYVGGLVVEEAYRRRLTTPDDRTLLFNLMNDNLDSQLSALWAINRRIAMDHDIPLVAYEGGQSLAPQYAAQRSNQAFVEFLHGTNRDNRMTDLYDDLAKVWRATGGRTLCYYDDLTLWNKFGSWGHREFMHDVDSPKWQAIQRQMK